MANPSHTYNASGNYTVKLTVYGSNGCISNDMMQLSKLIVSSFGTTTDITVYPNPATDNLQVGKLREGATVQLLDMSGFIIATYNAALSASLKIVQFRSIVS